MANRVNIGIKPFWDCVIFPSTGYTAGSGQTVSLRKYDRPYFSAGSINDQMTLSNSIFQNNGNNNVSLLTKGTFFARLALSGAFGAGTNTLKFSSTGSDFYTGLGSGISLPSANTSQKYYADFMFSGVVGDVISCTIDVANSTTLRNQTGVHFATYLEVWKVRNEVTPITYD